MEEKKNQKLKSFFFRTLVILNALFLFQINVEQVSAEELADEIETSAQTEMVSEPFEHSDDEFSDEVTSYTEDDGDVVDDEQLEEFPDESAEEEEVDSQEADKETKDDLLEEVTDTDSEDLLESEIDEDSETEEVDEVVVDEDKNSDSKVEETEETVDVDASEEDEDNEEDVEEIDEEKPEAKTASVQKNSSSKNQVEIDRIAGQNRYKNAAELSKSGWNSASTVILTNGEKFTDSLTGSPLASLHNAPILLTRADRLPSETLAEIIRLKPNEVIILGGELSVSNAVLETLSRNGFATKRIGGQNRYLLAENIAKEVMEKEGMNRDAFLVSGEVYSDAMSIASVAASKRLPIFLTKNNVLHQTVIDAIPHVNSWTIIGGHLTINQEVQNKMDELGAKTRRIDGRSRYDVNQNVINHYGASGDHMYVASGEHFSDATPASVLAARNKSSVLLVRDNNKADLKKQRDFANAKNINKLTLIGGTLTLSKETEDYFNNQNIVIYLDPGHGGNETGAYYYGVAEKDLNLKISFKIQDNLVNTGYTVVMSRETDKYVGLNARAKEANAIGADMFVSVHNNAFWGNSSVRGIETYHYPNSVEGKKLATAIHNELIRDTGTTGNQNRGVKSANFAVIRESYMPATLLELGFMSNKAELDKLRTNSYQNTLARAVTNGIIQYLN